MRKIPISLFQTQKSTDKHTNNIKNVFFLFISFALSFFLFTTAPKRTIYEYAKTSSKSKDMSLLNVWRKPSYRWTHVITAESSMKIGQWAHFFSAANSHRIQWRQHNFFFVLAYSIINLNEKIKKRNKFEWANDIYFATLIQTNLQIQAQIKYESEIALLREDRTRFVLHLIFLQCKRNKIETCSTSHSHSIL